MPNFNNFKMVDAGLGSNEMFLEKILLFDGCPSVSTPDKISIVKMHPDGRPTLSQGEK